MVTIKCIGFDLYSTLISTDNHNWTEMLKPVYSIIRELGYNNTFEAFLKVQKPIYRKWRDYRERHHVELKSEVWWKEILEKLDLQFTSADILKIRMASHQRYRSQIATYPEVTNILKKLKEKYTVVCISNISEGDFAREDMDSFGILQLFDYVLMSSDLGIRKPSPKIFQYILDLFHLQPDEMVFVGDTLYDDIQGAKAAKLRLAIHIKRDRSYFFPDYYIKPDRTILSLQELLDILLELK